MASLRGVGGVDLNERHSGSFGLIGEKCAKLGERPGMQRGPLGLAKPYPVTDSRQLLDSDAAPGAFSLGHDAFTDLVVNVGAKRASLRRRFFSNRRAELVFLACNRWRNLA